MHDCGIEFNTMYHPNNLIECIFKHHNKQKKKKPTKKKKRVETPNLNMKHNVGTGTLT